MTFSSFTFSWNDTDALNNDCCLNVVIVQTVSNAPAETQPMLITVLRRITGAKLRTSQGFLNGRYDLKTKF